MEQRDKNGFFLFIFKLIEMMIGCLLEKEEPIILCQTQHKIFIKSNRRRVHELKTPSTFQYRLNEEQSS